MWFSCISTSLNKRTYLRRQILDTQMIYQIQYNNNDSSEELLLNPFDQPNNQLIFELQIQFGHKGVHL